MSKLTKANQDIVKNFIHLLRNSLIEEGCHLAYVSDLSDKQILTDYRVCADCGETVCTEAQQMQAILESDSAERAYHILYSNLDNS